MGAMPKLFSSSSYDNDRPIGGFSKSSYDDMKESCGFTVPQPPILTQLTLNL